MTTIACNKTTIVADTLLSEGHLAMKGTKIYRLKDCIVGCSGDWNDGIKFVEWFKNKRKKKPELESFSALMVTNKQEIIYWDEDLVPNYIEETEWTIGSGRDFALGALAYGASLEEAVTIATRLDVYSGLPLQVEQITHYKAYNEFTNKPMMFKDFNYE